MVAYTWHEGYIAKHPDIVGGEPCIISTRVSVRRIVELWRSGILPEEIPLHLPHITLAQVFAALSYYADHQAEIVRYLEENRVPEELVHPVAQGAGRERGGAKRAPIRDRLPG